MKDLCHSSQLIKLSDQFQDNCFQGTYEQLQRDDVAPAGNENRQLRRNERFLEALREISTALDSALGTAAAATNGVRK